MSDVAERRGPEIELVAFAGRTRDDDVHTNCMRFWTGYSEKYREIIQSFSDEMRHMT